MKALVCYQTIEIIFDLMAGLVDVFEHYFFVLELLLEASLDTITFPP